MRESAKKLRDNYAGKPGAPLYRRTFGLWMCLDEWYEQGLSKDADLNELFLFDEPGFHQLGQLGWCEAAFEPEFPEEQVGHLSGCFDAVDRPRVRIGQSHRLAGIEIAYLRREGNMEFAQAFGNLEVVDEIAAVAQLNILHGLRSLNAVEIDRPELESRLLEELRIDPCVLYEKGWADQQFGLLPGQ